MSLNDDEDKLRCLDDEQRIDAKQMTDCGMIPAHKDDGQARQLTPEQLAEVRDCWGMGVPLRVLGQQHGLTEQELRVQLAEPAWKPIIEPPAEHRGLIGPDEVRQMREKRRQLEELKERFGGRPDGR